MTSSIRRFLSKRKAAVLTAAVLTGVSLTFIVGQPTASAACSWNARSNNGVMVWYSGCGSYIQIETIQISGRRAYAPVTYVIYRSNGRGGTVITRQGSGQLNRFGKGHFDPHVATQTSLLPVAVRVTVDGSTAYFNGIR